MNRSFPHSHLPFSLSQQHLKFRSGIEKLKVGYDDDGASSMKNMMIRWLSSDSLLPKFLSGCMFVHFTQNEKRKFPIFIFLFCSSFSRKESHSE